ncbi:hypothetical protein AHF37_03734 [Paragonimus kellicotti]|nr:hypothetical protein AHF37_03734 [Paragonimus kellicotti]
MKLKPSILRELVASESNRTNVDLSTKQPNSLNCLISPDDTIFLEDDVQRILLIFATARMKQSLSSANLATGVVVALLGLEPEKEPVSGLGFTGDGPVSQGHTLALQLLADWLRCSGDWSQMETTESGVVRLMILGDSIQSSVAHISTGPSASSFNQQPCDRMEATLIWGHLAPTCPDTLLGYPLITKDMLLLEQQPEQNGMKSKSSVDYPDIYVAGCQPGTRATWRRASLNWSERSAANASKEGALLIAVPRFCVSHTLVLVHLDTLECRTVRFDTSALDVAE